MEKKGPTSSERSAQRHERITTEVIDSIVLIRPSTVIFAKKIFSYIPLTLIVLLSIILRMLAAQESQGFVHPDEVFQTIEMVHYIIYGKYGVGQTIPWEYNLNYVYGGARSMVFVFLLAGLYKFLMFFGINDPFTLIYFVRLVLALCSIITVLVAYYFGKEAFNKYVGLISAFICGIWWFFPFWSSRTMTDSLSSDFLFLSIFLIYKTIKKDRIKNKVIYASIAGVCIGFAFMIRFPSALMGFPLALILLGYEIKEIIKLRKDKSSSKNSQLRILAPFGSLVLSALLMVIFQGIIDVLTWGSFLHSPINFFIYNIVEGKSELHGVSPWYYYFRGLVFDFAYLFIPLFLVFFILNYTFREKVKEKIYISLLIVYWLTIFSILGHKEFRFIMTILPLSILLVSYGIYRFVKFFKKKYLQYSMTAFILMVFATSSIYMALVEKGWIWKWNSGVCNAMYWVGQQEDSNQLIVCETVWYTGGYAYLDKNITCYFIKISFFAPYKTINSTIFLEHYKKEGTYLIIRSEELAFSNILPKSFDEFFNEQGFTLVRIIGSTPSAFVYRNNVTAV